jgi:hypothetical protein
LASVRTQNDVCRRAVLHVRHQHQQEAPVPLTIIEPATYDAYSSRVDAFQRYLRGLSQSKGDEADRRAEFSEERAKGSRDHRRFVADRDGQTVGWMVLKVKDGIRVEGICVDIVPERRKGVSVATIQIV